MPISSFLPSTAIDTASYVSSSNRFRWPYVTDGRMDGHTINIMIYSTVTFWLFSYVSLPYSCTHLCLLLPVFSVAWSSLLRTMWGVAYGFWCRSHLSSWYQCSKTYLFVVWAALLMCSLWLLHSLTVLDWCSCSFYCLSLVQDNYLKLFAHVSMVRTIYSWTLVLACAIQIDNIAG